MKYHTICTCKYNYIKLHVNTKKISQDTASCIYIYYNGQILLARVDDRGRVSNCTVIAAAIPQTVLKSQTVCLLLAMVIMV